MWNVRLQASYIILHRDQEAKKREFNPNMNSTLATISSSADKENPVQVGCQLNNYCSSADENPRSSKALFLPSAVVKFECRGKTGISRVLLDGCSQLAVISYLKHLFTIEIRRRKFGLEIAYAQ